MFLTTGWSTPWNFTPWNFTSQSDRMLKMPQKKSKANIALGAAIRAARESQGHSQEVFANRAGIDRSYYGAIERGEFNITVDTLLTVAQGLDVTAAQLLEQAAL